MGSYFPAAEYVELLQCYVLTNTCFRVRASITVTLDTRSKFHLVSFFA